MFTAKGCSTPLKVGWLEIEEEQDGGQLNLRKSTGGDGAMADGASMTPISTFFWRWRWWNECKSFGFDQWKNYERILHLYRIPYTRLQKRDFLYEAFSTTSSIGTL
ncbi:hypothetical protein ACJX0J_028438 [Zea mays]